MHEYLEVYLIMYNDLDLYLNVKVYVAINELDFIEKEQDFIDEFTNHNLKP